MYYIPTTHPITSTLRAPGVWGGKINTCIGSQNAIFKGAQVHAGRHSIEPGDEIFISYGKSFRFNNSPPDDERQDWVYARRGRVTRAGPTNHSRRTGATPAPLRGGEGGHTFPTGSVFQHTFGVSTPS